MREIKFRGKRIDNGQLFYGYLIQEFSNFRVARSYIYHNLVMHEVDPETIAQLIGHDSQGREVYEGDKITDETGNEYTATLDLVIAWTDEKTGALQTISIDNAKRFTKLTLVEVP